MTRIDKTKSRYCLLTLRWRKQKWRGMQIDDSDGTKFDWKQLVEATTDCFIIRRPLLTKNLLYYFSQILYYHSRFPFFAIKLLLNLNLNFIILRRDKIFKLVSLIIVNLCLSIILDVNAKYVFMAPYIESPLMSPLMHIIILSKFPTGLMMIK